MTLEVGAFGCKGEFLLRHLELLLKRGLDLTKEQEFLNGPSIFSGEGITMLSIEDVGTTKRLWPVLIQEIPEVMPVAMSQYEHLIARRSGGPRFDQSKPIGWNSRQFLDLLRSQ